MPGRLATLRDLLQAPCRPSPSISASSAKITAGTRIAPARIDLPFVSARCATAAAVHGRLLITHRRCIAAIQLPSRSVRPSNRSTSRPSVRRPGAWRAAIDRLAPGAALAAVWPCNDDLEAAEQHVPHRHLVDQPVQPVVEQQQVRTAPRNSNATAVRGSTARDPSRARSAPAPPARRLGLALAPMPRTPISAPCGKCSN